MDTLKSGKSGAHVGGIASAGMVHGVGVLLTLCLNFGIMGAIGAGAYGTYIFGLSAAHLASILGRLGVERFGIRLLVPAWSDQQAGLLKGIIVWAFSVSLVGTGLISIILVAVSGFFPAYGESLRLAAPIALITTFLMACQGVLRSTGSAAVATIPDFVLRPLFTILLIGAALLLGFVQWRDPVFLLLLYGIGTALAALVSSCLVAYRLPIAKFSEEPIKLRGREWIRIALPIHWGNVMVLTQPQLVILIAGVILDPTATGWVGFAVRVAAAISIPLSVVGLYAAPKIVRRYKSGDVTGLQSDLTLYCRVTTLMGLAAAVSLALLLSLGVAGFVDKSFTGSEWLVMTFVFGQLLTAITGPVGQLLTMTSYERETAWVSTVSLIILMMGGVLAALAAGVFGIAIAAAVAVGYRSAACFLIARKRLNIWTLPIGGRAVGSTDPASK